MPRTRTRLDPGSSSRNDPLFPSSPLDRFLYTTYITIPSFFFLFFYTLGLLEREETRDRELSLLEVIEVEDPRMTRERVFSSFHRVSKREPRISRACDETQERHSREPLESGDLSSNTRSSPLTLSREKKSVLRSFVDLLFFLRVARVPRFHVPPRHEAFLRRDVDFPIEREEDDCTTRTPRFPKLLPRVSLR